MTEPFDRAAYDELCDRAHGDFVAATARHLERLTTVPGLVAHMLQADDLGGEEGRDLPAPEPQDVAQPDIDDGPWDLYSWLVHRLGRTDGDAVWGDALRWYDAIMAGGDPPAGEPHVPVDAVTGLPVGETIVLRCTSGGPLGPPIRATEWRASDVGLLFLPVDGRWCFTPWRFIAQVEVAD